MLKLSINIAFLSLLLGPIAICFVVFIKYVANDINNESKAKIATSHYPKHIEEKSIPNLRVVK